MPSYGYCWYTKDTNNIQQIVAIAVVFTHAAAFISIAVQWVFASSPDTTMHA